MMTDHFERVAAQAVDWATQPINRRSSPEEQAAPLVYLNSASASYVNGVIFPADGGFMAGLLGAGLLGALLGGGFFGGLGGIASFLGLILQVGLVVLPEGEPVDVPDGVAVGGGFGTDRRCHLPAPSIHSAIPTEFSSPCSRRAVATLARRSAGWFWFSFHLPSIRSIERRKPTIWASRRSTRRS